MMRDINVIYFILAYVLVYMHLYCQFVAAHNIYISSIIVLILHIVQKEL